MEKLYVIIIFNSRDKLNNNVLTLLRQLKDQYPHLL